MNCSDQQIRLIRFFSLFNVKTRYGRSDTAKSLDNSHWSLSRSRSPNLWNVSESQQSRSIFSRSRSGVGVKNFRLRTLLLHTTTTQPQLYKPQPEQKISKFDIKVNTAII